MNQPALRCQQVFAECVAAIGRGDLIESVSARDKEFHFQNWFQQRLEALDLDFETAGRNAYPDFRVVDSPEGFEVKGLAWPGRERNYDANSQLPSGVCNGRTIYYVFGRYPADLSPYGGSGATRRRYPVIDLVICHGDFLNADHDYVHQNRNIKGFGSYGDIMIRDRKMYVAPTPFALTDGTTGLATLILPDDAPVDRRFRRVGTLVRREAERVVVGYRFDLRSNVLIADTVPNPHAGRRHGFAAFRLRSQSDREVSMVAEFPGRGSEEDEAE